MALIESLIGTRNIPYENTRILEDFFGQEVKKNIFIIIDPRLYNKRNIDNFYYDFFEQIRNNRSSKNLKLLTGEKYHSISLRNEIIRIVTNSTKEGFRFLVIFKTVRYISQIQNEINDFITYIDEIYSDRISCIYSVYRYDDSHKNVTYLKPLPKEEVEYQAKKYFRECNASDPDERFVCDVYKYSGGIAGIMKQMFIERIKDKNSNPCDVLKNGNNYIQEIMNILNEKDLTDLGIAIENPKSTFIVDSYIKKTGLAECKEVIQVLLDNYEKFCDIETNLLSTLTLQQISLLSFFRRNRGRIIKRKEVAENMWGKNYHQKYSNWAIDKAVSDLRKKLRGKEKIITKKGVGYIVV